MVLSNDEMNIRLWQNALCWIVGSRSPTRAMHQKPRCRLRQTALLTEGYRAESLADPPAHLALAYSRHRRPHFCTSWDYISPDSYPQPPGRSHRTVRTTNMAGGREQTPGSVGRRPRIVW